MTSRERIFTAAFLKVPDVIPVAPYMGNFGAVVAGVPIDKYCRNGSLMAGAQLKAWEICGQDVLVVQSDNYYIAEGFGVTVDHHENSTPTVRDLAVKALGDIEGLAVPDPQRDGRMPVYLEAIDRLKGAVKGEAAIRCPGTGPFSLAGHLMGTESFLISLAMADSEEDTGLAASLRLLMDKTTEALILFHKACVDAGANIIHNGDSLASLSMISPAMYRKWVFPYEKRHFTAINSYMEGKDAFSLLHICGNTERILTSMADTGAHILEIDSLVDLKVAKNLVGNRVCLMGNIEPSQVLFQGTEADVERECRAAIQAAEAGGGFILGSGCEVPPNAPLANIKAMVRIGHGHSCGNTPEK